MGTIKRPHHDGGLSLGGSERLHAQHLRCVIVGSCRPEWGRSLLPITLVGAGGEGQGRIQGIKALATGYTITIRATHVHRSDQRLQVSMDGATAFHTALALWAPGGGWVHDILRGMHNDRLRHTARQTVPEAPHRAGHLGQGGLGLAQMMCERVQPRVKTFMQSLAERRPWFPCTDRVERDTLSTTYG
jgi:hypothetical protein